MPVHMFLKWFVPFRSSGSRLMAILLLPALAAAALSAVPNATARVVLAVLTGLAGVGLHAYHRRPHFADAILTGLASSFVTLLFFEVFTALRQNTP